MRVDLTRNLRKLKIKIHLGLYSITLRICISNDIVIFIVQFFLPYMKYHIQNV